MEFIKEYLIDLFVCLTTAERIERSEGRIKEKVADSSLRLDVSRNSSKCLGNQSYSFLLYKFLDSSI